MFNSKEIRLLVLGIIFVLVFQFYDRISFEIGLVYTFALLGSMCYIFWQWRLDENKIKKGTVLYLPQPFIDHNTAATRGIAFTILSYTMMQYLFVSTIRIGPDDILFYNWLEYFNLLDYTIIDGLSYRNVEISILHHFNMVLLSMNLWFVSPKPRKIRFELKDKDLLVRESNMEKHLIKDYQEGVLFEQVDRALLIKHPDKDLSFFNVLMTKSGFKKFETFLKIEERGTVRGESFVEDTLYHTMEAYYKTK